MKFRVEKISALVAYPMLLDNHYAHRIPSISYAYGLFENDKLVGVCTFGTPPSHPLKIGLCGKEYANRVVELNRLWTEDAIERNASSFFVSHCLRWLPRPLIIVSYADPTANHVGYTYQACNFVYTGLSAKRTDWKIKGREHLHGVSVADISRGHKDRAKFMREKFGDDFYLAPRPQKHRYVYFLGSKKERREMQTALKYPILPYPKKNNEN